MANNALNLVLTQLDLSPEGQEICPDVILPLSDWQWLKDRWHRNAKFGNIDKDAARKLLRVEDVVDNAKGVKFVGKSKRAWVKGEPEPLDTESNAA